jgi:transcriptional regulator with XRE-family HTH domain
VDTLGSRIKQTRFKRGLNQEQFAQPIGSYQKQVSAYENDKHQPSIEVLKAIGATLKVSIDWLLGLTDYPDLPNDQTQPESISEQMRAARIISNLPMADRVKAVELLQQFEEIHPEHRDSCVALVKTFRHEFSWDRGGSDSQDE